MGVGRGALVIVAEEVEEPMDQEPVALALEPFTADGGLPARGLEGDDDVAEKPVGGRASALALREREDIGRPVDAAVAAVEGPHGPVRDHDQ
jgi:hypothetical protein